MRPGPVLKGFVWTIYALIALPLLVVIGVSLNSTARFIITPLEPSLHWYAEFFSRPEYVRALFYVTLPLASVT
jgi:ABC-type spermidine/putrescine transport system permease subunit II